MQLLQLMLAVFGFYAALKYTGIYKYIVPLASLILLYLLDKVEVAVEKREEKAEEKKQAEEKIQATESINELQPAIIKQQLDCLLFNKNVLLLTDSIQLLLRDLGFVVSPSSDSSLAERVLQMPGREGRLGLKIISDVAEPTKKWSQWDKISQYEKGAGGEQRLLIIANNVMLTDGEEEKKFKNFSNQANSLLATRHTVAMTTLTLYKVYRLCKEKGLDPKRIFRLIYQHPGGIFQLKHYSSVQ